MTIPLLSDAKTREDFSEQIARRELARDLADVMLRKSQFFRHEFARFAIGEQLNRRGDVRLRTAKCVEMATASGERCGRAFLQTHAVF